jgi:O-6-methylguanine DNA methyltransferase
MDRWEEWSVYESPLGPLTLGAGEGGIGRIRFPGEGEPVPIRGEGPGAGLAAAWGPGAVIAAARGPGAGPAADRGSTVGPAADGATVAAGWLATVTAQLAEYFAGERRGFEVDLDLRGTPLQLRVWELLRRIPYGATTSYGELTEQIDAALFPAALEPWRRVRAVGTEIGRTPTPIVVPCHRVIGADGSLVGYGGGLERKAALLALERAHVVGEVPVPDWGDQQLALI